MAMNVLEQRVTLCGETRFMGVPCALIRFAGCQLNCRWCDTPGARDPTAGTPTKVQDLVRWVDQTGMKFVLLTGGEPLLQPELPVLAAELSREREVMIETSGALDIQTISAPVMRCVDVKCPGSGEVDRNHWDNMDHLRPGDAVKMVLTDRRDYDFAKEVIQHHALGEPVNILLSCAYPQLDAEVLATWMLEDRLTNARLNPQLHKLLWPRLG